MHCNSGTCGMLRVGVVFASVYKNAGKQLPEALELPLKGAANLCSSEKRKHVAIDPEGPLAALAASAPFHQGLGASSTANREERSAGSAFWASASECTAAAASSPGLPMLYRDTSRSGCDSGGAPKKTAVWWPAGSFFGSRGVSPEVC